MNNYLYSLTDNKDTISEIANYCRNSFSNSRLSEDVLQIMDEPFVDEWKATISIANAEGMDKAIKSHRLLGNKNIKLSRPELAEIYLYPSFGGNIPIIFAKYIDDFEELICKIVYKGVMHPNIKKMRASFIKGRTADFKFT